jgi:hypothetical protein
VATSTLANPSQPEQHYTGTLFDDLIRTVENVEQPKPPQPAAAETESDVEQERRLRG